MGDTQTILHPVFVQHLCFCVKRFVSFITNICCFISSFSAGWLCDGQVHFLSRYSARLKRFCQQQQQQQQRQQKHQCTNSEISKHQQWFPTYWQWIDSNKQKYKSISVQKWLRNRSRPISHLKKDPNSTSSSASHIFSATTNLFASLAKPHFRLPPRHSPPLLFSVLQQPYCLTRQPRPPPLHSLPLLFSVLQQPYCLTRHLSQCKQQTASFFEAQNYLSFKPLNKAGVLQRILCHT